MQRPRGDGAVRHTRPRGADVEEFSPLGQIGYHGPQVYLCGDEGLLRSLRCEDPLQTNPDACRGCTEQIHGGPGRLSRSVGKLVGWRILEADAQRRWRDYLRRD